MLQEELFTKQRFPS